MVQLPLIQSPMSPVIQLIFKIIPLLIFVGCASVDSTPHAKVKSPLTKVYVGPFEKVWQSAQLVMAQYPMRVNNIDLGLIETDVITGESTFTAPEQENRRPGGYRYNIRLHLVKGRTQGQPSVKVSVKKSISLQRDFFSAEEDLPTDGLEETVILYRIQRELDISAALDKAHSASN